MTFGIEEDENTVKISKQGNPKQFSNEVENLIHRGAEEVNIVASGGAIRKAVSTLNVFKRSFEEHGIETSIEVEISEERTDHHDDDKEYFYHDEILIKVFEE